MKPLPTLLGAVLILALTSCNSSSRPDPMANTMGEARIDFSRTTMFDGSVLTVDLSSDDETLKLNTLRDAIATEEYRPAIPNRSGRSWVMRNTAYDSTSVVYALVSWDNDDPTDYLAAGWWVHIPLLDSSPTNIGRVAFIDGPEIDSANPPTMPVAGGGHYVGLGGGVVIYEFGSSWGNLAGSYALGEYAGTVTVIADFDRGTVAGCLGCIGDIRPAQRHLVSVYEDVLRIDLPDVLAPVEDYEIHYAPVPYNSDGTFESTTGTVMHPTRIITEADAFWGGSFSNVDDPNGHPRLVGGFSDAQFVEDDGSEGFLWGILNVLSTAMLPPAPPGSVSSR